MPSNDIVIAAAVRTAVGSFNGSFATLPAHELGRTAIAEALKRGKVAPDEVDEVILGQILAAGEGMNPARQASIGAGLPKETTAWEVNQVCGSGLRTVALGMQQIQVGDADIIVAGGQELMSMSPHCAHLRGGVKMGELQMIDTMIRDGLWDIFNGYHMGVTAENVAREYQVTREQQDEFAVASQNKAEAAKNAGKFKDEIVPVTIKTRKGDIVVDQDEHIRPGTTMESVAKLRPAFQKDGTVTAGNASGINDGAAAIVLMSARRCGQTRGDAARPHRVVGDRRRRSGGDGHRADPGVAQGAQKGRLVGRRSRPGRGQRGLRRPGLRGQQGAGLGPGQRQRQRRRHRHRPPDRRLRRAHPGDAAARDEAARRQEGPGDAVHRRRHGHRHVR